ncbi:hypothetical protein CRE_18295 [Caenorhabditis remanei]|uniref:Uncharacterized protein n=1 Tax=Caenorhabditis remanei TaxID=31234 RepID=E3NMM1_CAERE|nr:hypothetical protein CRE_18295 [Caenorhabditis remanei]
MDGVHLSKFVNLAVTNSSCINNISRVFIQYGPSILHTYLWQVSLLFLRFYRVFSAFPTLQFLLFSSFYSNSVLFVSEKTKKIAHLTQFVGIVYMEIKREKSEEIQNLLVTQRVFLFNCATPIE